MPGLRKEEVAALAGMSTDHYSRLEQGRQATLSEQVVRALAVALHLDEVAAAHLRDLAAPGRARRAPAEGPQHPDPGLLRVMTALDGMPVLLLGRRGDVLARNALLAELLGRPFAPGASFLRYLLTDPIARERITNWDSFAAAAVGGLRLELGRRPHDVTLQGLVEELSAIEPAVASWWGARDVADRTSLRKHLHHPQAGPLVFDVEAVVTPHDPDQRLVVYTAEPDSATARVLPLLRCWAATGVGST